MPHIDIRGSMARHIRVIVNLKQSVPATVWGRPLHAWLDSVNGIGCARCPDGCYRNGTCGIHYHVLLLQYSQNYSTYNTPWRMLHIPRKSVLPKLNQANKHSFSSSRQLSMKRVACPPDFFTTISIILIPSASKFQDSVLTLDAVLVKPSHQTTKNYCNG